MNQDSMSRINATQNVIRNKYKKAYTRRLEHEHDVNQSMIPLTAATTTVESKNKDFSLQNLSKTPNVSSHLTTKSFSKRAIKSRSIKTNKEKRIDPNTLCDSLKILLTSSQNVGEMKCMQISSILDELRKLEIIV